MEKLFICLIVPWEEKRLGLTFEHRKLGSSCAIRSTFPHLKAKQADAAMNVSHLAHYGSLLLDLWKSPDFYFDTSPFTA